MSDEKKTMSGLSRARRHFEGGLAARAERLRQLTEDCVGPAATEVAEALVREIYAVRTSARVFKIRPLEQEAQAVAERLEREIERGAGGSTESRDSVLEFLAGLAGYGNAQAARESGPRLSAPPLLRESQEVVYRTDADAMVKNYLSVLVVGHSDLPSQVRNALPGQRFEVITCSDWQTALRIAENQRPDVIIAERALGAENTTVMWGRLARLGLPWVEVIPEMREGVERRRWPQIAPPFGTDEVLHAIEKATGLLAQDDGKMGRLGNLTLEGVTARLVREIERGLLEATDAGHDVQVPMDGGTEVLAAAWSAVAQVRALVSRRSGGRVQFRDPPSVIGTSLLAMGGVGDPGGKHEAVDLVGRRIVIADDDRAVRWFFTRLLQGAGAQVVPAADGREALAVSRALRPDLIISDILMPELDGLALCRQVRRDPTLWDIPVVLLSWKDDFIQQMRDLEAGAQDYLRKEEEEGQLLRRISATLEPRREIERRLRSTGDVRGRLEPIGVGVLLRTVGAERQQADVELRSYEHRIDVRIRQGNVAEVIVDMRDGMRVVGAPAIRALAGIRGGRFWVTGATQSPEASPGMRGRFALAEAQGELFGMLEACQGERVAAIQEVSLEPVFLGLGGEACSRLEVQLMEGGTPLDAVADGTLSADEVALLLEELVLRGACIRLRGAEGQDLGAEHLLGRRGDEGVRREEGRTMREVKPRPGTLLQWGRDGAEARTFAEFELAEAKVRQELNSTSVEPEDLEEVHDSSQSSTSGAFAFQ